MKAVWIAILMAAAPVQVSAVDLKVGATAPKFELLDDAGNSWASTEHVGKRAGVLCFSQASFTGGCTVQARAVQVDQKRFAGLDVAVVGVSGDMVKTRAAFKKVHSLGFTLLSDEKGAAAKVFGVTVKPGGTAKQRIGDTVEEFTRGVTINWWTFVIDKAGKIAYKNTKVTPGQDSRSVLDVLEKL